MFRHLHFYKLLSFLHRWSQSALSWELYRQCSPVLFRIAQDTSFGDKCRKVKWVMGHLTSWSYVVDILSQSSCDPSWPWTCYLHSWAAGMHHDARSDVVLGNESRVSCMLDKHSTQVQWVFWKLNRQWYFSTWLSRMSTHCWVNVS